MNDDIHTYAMLYQVARTYKIYTLYYLISSYNATVEINRISRLEIPMNEGSLPYQHIRIDIPSDEVKYEYL
jgi:hypothetical protein